MDFIIQRYSNMPSSGGSSQGILMEKETTNFFSHTIEDEGRKTKVKGETRIWAGFYELKILKLENDWTLRHRTKYGDWFKFPIEVTNVKDFSGVLIHVGYGEQDTEGCILLCDTIGNNSVNRFVYQNSLGAFSMDAVQRFYQKVYPYLEQGGKVTLEIRDEIFLIR